MKTSLSQRLKDNHPKENLQKFIKFLLPNPEEEDLAGTSITNPFGRKHSNRPTETATDKEFIAYRSERDNLGRLKNLSSRRSTQPTTTNNRAANLPKLQLSIYNSMKDKGVTEPLDLISGDKFKIVDGFERQINIIIRNKEFMTFLKDEKSNQAVTRKQKHQLHRFPEPAKGS
jgi:hypothetical protein